MKKVSAKKASSMLPVLSAEANKYTRGTCELIVGSERYPGAGVLASLAANAAGAGYTRVYTCRETAFAIRLLQPSTVIAALGEFLQDRHESADGHPLAVVMGCGVECASENGRPFDPAVRNSQFLLDALEAVRAPVVVDGGGLNALMCNRASEVLATRRACGYPTVITPHRGEAARLAEYALFEANAVPEEGVERASEEIRAAVEEMPADELALLIASSFASVCVLKGPDTFIAAPDAALDDVRVMREGTAVLAKAGTGDVLAGMIGSLLAQGCDALDAACAGTYLHALAGHKAMTEQGVSCVRTEDVLKCIPAAFREVLGW